MLSEVKRRDWIQSSRKDWFSSYGTFSRRDSQPEVGVTARRKSRAVANTGVLSDGLNSSRAGPQDVAVGGNKEAHRAKVSVFETRLETVAQCPFELIKNKEKRNERSGSPTTNAGL